MGHAQDFHPPIQQPPQRIHAQLPGLRIHRPHHQLRAAAPAKPLPGADVGFVILPRDDDLVPRPNDGAAGHGQSIEVLGGGRPEGNRVRRHPQQTGHAAAAIIHLLPRNPQDFRGPKWLRLVGAIKMQQPLQHRPGHITPPGVFKKRSPRRQRLAKSRKTGAHELQVKARIGGRGHGLRWL